MLNVKKNLQIQIQMIAIVKLKIKRKREKKEEEKTSVIISRKFFETRLNDMAGKYFGYIRESYK